VAPQPVLGEQFAESALLGYRLLAQASRQDPTRGLPGHEYRPALRCRAKRRSGYFVVGYTSVVATLPALL